MRLYYSLFAASFPLVADAFGVTPPARVALQRKNPLFGYLEDLNDVDAGPVFENADTIAEFDGYLDKVEKAFGRAQKRLDKIQSQLKTKERSSQEAVNAVEERMKHQEVELTDKLEVKDREAKNVKIEAERERRTSIGRHRAREERLEHDTQTLLKALEAEKENLETNKDVIKQNLVRQAELNAELEELKQRLVAETENWSVKYQAEQEARRLEVAEAQRKVDEMQASAQLVADQTEQRLSSLQEKLSTKEEQKEEAILAIKNEMLTQEQALKEMSREEIETLRDEYATREDALRGEMEDLIWQLNDEKKKVRVNQEMTDRIHGKRVALDAELGELKQRYDQESEHWSAKYEQEHSAYQQSILETKQKLDEQQEQALLEAKELESRLSGLKEQLSIKEKQKQAAVLAIKDELKSKEQEFKEIANEMGNQITKTKIEANLREMKIAGKTQERERQLQNEMDGLRGLLQGEKESQKINQDLKHRILAQRVEIDRELGELKRLYEQDSKHWDSKYTKEHAARRLEVATAQQELEQLQASAEAAVTEAEQRQVSLSEQLATKEKQQLAATIALKDEMKNKEREFKAITGEMGNQITTTKIEANLREMAIAGKTQARERHLHNEMDGLRGLLQGEKESQKISQDLKHRILAQRVEIDRELGELKLRYEEDSKQWDSKYAKEQEERRLEVSKAQEQMQQLQATAESAVAEAEEKEKQIEVAILAIKDELKDQEQELMNMVVEIGDQANSVKVEAYRREMATADELKAKLFHAEEETKNAQEELAQLKKDLSEKDTLQGNVDALEH